MFNRLSVLDVSEKFVECYISEYDNKLAVANLPLNPEFIHEVEIAAEIVLGPTAAGFFGKMGSDLYEKIKQELQRRYLNKSSKENPRVLIIEGAGVDETILNFGHTRPAFSIGKGNVLILKDLTILYSGDPSNLIEEEVAPSFIPINVMFKKVTE